MGVNNDNLDDLDNSWKRNPMPGENEDFKGSNFMMVALILSAVGILVAINFL
ncbi:hypothetical protein MMIC_P0546 [Mariprofundus micogutta]|uniref:Uncharacterized protein n=1 Tax=Mariprofundus micogutta TaxID=1921010 RepID=A0A1L8CKZ1_9PROT|nr:hypothetical protein [Mariprofundus micogutta]GAV19598.1 hypothetical protein MMIC_P0546 [Mariprofundus micogutta]